jgi:hypothetical protein
MDDDLFQRFYGAGTAVRMQDGGKPPPGIKRATERAKESKSVASDVYASGGAVHMQDGGDPTQMFNFNPMAAKAAKQKQMRESTPETPLGALTKGFGTGLFGSTEEQVPYSGSIMEGTPQRQQSQANLRELGRTIGAATDIGGMVTPFVKPAAQAVTRGASSLGRAGLEQVDRAMFGEGPLASLVAPVTPLQAAPRVQAPVSKLGFYDPVEQAGMNIQRKQGPGQAFLNELQRSENVSKDFLEASGIAEKLRMAPNITREEVQAMTKGAVPEVQEVVLGSNVIPPSVTEFAKVHMPDFNPSNKESIAKLAQIADQRYQKALAEGDLDIAEFAEQAETEAKKLASQYESGSKPADRPSKYAEYQLPGGKNYREVLLTVPEKSLTELPQGYSVKLLPDQPHARAQEGYKVVDQSGMAIGHSTRMDGRFNTEEEAIKGALEALNKGSVFSGLRNSFRSNHWTDPNVVSHIRMNDRTDFEGKKVLFIEEMQSDWAQQGRKKGFGQEVPEGPFVKNTNEWVDLSLKNILKRAVDEGYDRVAFINGKQSADRYKLTNYVDRVDFLRRSGGIAPGPEKMGDGLLIAYDKQGNRAIEKYINDPEHELPDVIGIEASQKLLEQKPEQTRFAGEGAAKWSLQGAGLEVGGKGMKDFYDRIVPDRLKKIAKQDLKPIDVGTRERRFEGESEMPEGRPIGIRELNNGMLTLDLEGSSTGWGMWSPSERQNAERALKRFQQKYSESVPQQLGIDITPEIRERFSKPIAYKKGGAVRISDNPDTMLLELMRNGRYA